MPRINHDLVRARRDELDLSNAALASKLGLATGSVENIVCGAVLPSMRAVHRMSRVLDIPVHKIVASDVGQDGERTPQGDPSEPPVQPKNEPKGPTRRQDREGGRKAPKRVTDQRAGAA